MFGENLTLVQQIAVWSLPVLLGITLHEAAHAWSASKLGDNTAKALGRVSINPIKHIDLVGTIIIPAVLLLLGSPFLFGWAKPVPVNWSNLKNPRRDSALVAAAGPLANLLMALVWALVAKVGHGMGESGHFFMLAGFAGMLVNSVLMLLNLLPILPLDGGRVVQSLLPARLAYNFGKLEPYGFFILIALLATDMLSMVLSPLITGFTTGLVWLIGGI